MQTGEAKLQNWQSLIQLLPSVARIGEAHRQAGQQPDNLCEPYWIAVLLQAFGGGSLDAASVGQLARSLLPIGDPTQWLPPGATSRQDYSVSLAQTPHLNESGTAIAGLIEATLKASDGIYTLVPLQADWSGEWIEALLQLCQDVPQWQAIPICNIQTGSLWSSRLGMVEAIAYLQGSDIQPPAADWNVGHFITLAGVLQGAARSLVLVRDTYLQFGWDGYHLQPASAIAAALNRKDDAKGGILLFTATQNQAEVEQQCQALGLAIAPWNNNTPWAKE